MAFKSCNGFQEHACSADSRGDKFTVTLRTRAWMKAWVGVGWEHEEEDIHLASQQVCSRVLKKPDHPHYQEYIQESRQFNIQRKTCNHTLKCNTHILKEKKKKKKIYMLLPANKSDRMRRVKPN